MRKASSIDIEGHKVYLETEDLENLENIEFVACSNILRSECPVVAEGKWSSDGDWLFFRTYSSDSEYDLEYDEFLNGLLISKEEVFDSNG